jgi:hypothetical protein
MIVKNIKIVRRNGAGRDSVRCRVLPPCARLREKLKTNDDGAKRKIEQEQFFVQIYV